MTTPKQISDQGFDTASALLTAWMSGDQTLYLELSDSLTTQELFYASTALVAMTSGILEALGSLSGEGGLKEWQNFAVNLRRRGHGVGS